RAGRGRQPLQGASPAAFDRTEVHGSPLLGNGATGATADLTTIHFAERHDFSGRAGEESLVSHVNLITGNPLLNNLQAHFFSQRKDRTTGDTVQARGQLRSIEYAVTDDENVFATAFRHVTFRIQQQGFFTAAAQRFVQGQHGVDIVPAGLGLGHADVHVMAGVGRNSYLDPFFL